MSTSELNINIYQGATWQKAISWQNSSGEAYDLSAYSARMMIRRNYADNDRSLPLVSLTDSDGITLGSSGDNITIVISDDVTESIPSGTYYYDIELIDADSVVTKLLRGKAIVLPEVTR